MGARMGDDDLIWRGDALKIALAYASGEGAALAEHAIRAIPAAAINMVDTQELIEAYQDIIDYGPVVLAKNSQWERLKAAQAKVYKEKP